jgi:hypothetical protein
MKCEGCGKDKTCYDYHGHAMCRSCIDKYKSSVRKAKIGRFVDGLDAGFRGGLIGSRTIRYAGDGRRLDDVLFIIYPVAHYFLCANVR